MQLLWVLPIMQGIKGYVCMGKAAGLSDGF